VRKLILKSRMGILPAQDYETAKNNKNHTGECPLCGARKTVIAKGFLVRPSHAIGGGCQHVEMQNMNTARADDVANWGDKTMRNHRKGECRILSYTGKRGEERTHPRVIPNCILTRGQCRRDGKDNPAPKDGPDTIPHFVDALLIEGMEDCKGDKEYTQAEAKKAVKHIHVIEYTYTDDEKWGQALLGKYKKYGPLMDLLKAHGFKATLHVMATGRTGTLYEHNKKILEKLGHDSREATKALQKLHDLTVKNAHDMYWLYRKLVQEHEQNRIAEAKRKEKEKANETHPT